MNQNPYPGFGYVPNNPQFMPNAQGRGNPVFPYVTTPMYVGFHSTL
jgi:hypothetical protein